jgi:hypothetical protein
MHNNFFYEFFLYKKKKNCLQLLGTFCSKHLEINSIRTDKTLQNKAKQTNINL